MPKYIAWRSSLSTVPVHHVETPHPFISPSFPYYRPQRSWGKVMFLQVSVILLTGGRGVPHTPPGADTPGSRHPPEQTPPTRQSRHPPSRHPPQSRHPPSRHPPQSKHPPEQTPPRADTPPEQTPPWRAWCEIWSTRGRYASYWDAILYGYASCKFPVIYRILSKNPINYRNLWDVCPYEVRGAIVWGGWGGNLHFTPDTLDPQLTFSILIKFFQNANLPDIFKLLSRNSPFNLHNTTLQN